MWVSTWHAGWWTLWGKSRSGKASVACAQLWGSLSLSSRILAGEGQNDRIGCLSSGFCGFSHSTLLQLETLPSCLVHLLSTLTLLSLLF